MLLILSQNGDRSALNVIKWLIFYKIEFISINEDTKLKVVDFKISDFKISLKCTIGEQEVDLMTITKFWYRRGEILYDFLLENFNNQSQIMNHLNYEINTITSFLFEHLQATSSTGNIFKTNINKLSNLVIARNVGFQIPETRVLNQRNNLIELLESNKKLITKVLSNSINFTFKKPTNLTKYISYTELLNFNVAKKLNPLFAPALIQSKIEKKYEIRVFIFQNKIWPMCIISQKNDKTSLDYRNYDLQNPNRCVPYKLPKVIMKNIILFMKKAGLNTGSIDLIVNKENEYVFLEVNPDGQFDTVSFNCNYYIEKKIAENYVGR